MLQLRIRGDRGLIGTAFEVLNDDPGVSEIQLTEDASITPPGDVIHAFVAREAADEVIARLRELGVGREGSLTCTDVRTWISKDAHQAEATSPGSGADTVVWAEVTQQAYADAEPNWTFMCLFALASLLAGIAIILDSQILVIGAMVIGPEFGAIAALGVALVRRRWGLLGRAWSTLFWGVVVGAGATWLAALAGRALGWISETDITAPRPQTGFIYHPDKWSFVVALIAASAGVLALTSARVGALSGVFISVTTIPAVANIGVGLAFGVWHEVTGSLLQLLVNLSGMAIAGWLTLLIQQTVWSRVSAHRRRVLDKLKARRSG